MRIRTRLLGALLVCAAAVVGLWIWWHAHRLAPSRAVSVPSSSAPVQPVATPAQTTHLYAHNLLLRKGPVFRVYIPWVRGEMIPSRAGRMTSFDDTDSFLFDIHQGVVHVRLEDLSNFLNAGLVKNAPLSNIKLQPKGQQLQLNGTLHKVIPLPVQLICSLSVTPDDRIRFHIEHVSVLKVPMKGLLGAVHIAASDLVHSGAPGIEIKGDDIIFDTQVLLPPPHIRGDLTSVSLVTDIHHPVFEAVYGNARNDRDVEKRWRNFLRLQGGSLRFGKLIMQDADLIMIDATKDQWFDLDLANYQNQLVNGITYTTPEEGLEIYMPSLDALPKRKDGRTVSREWLRDRNLPLPENLLP